MGSYVIVKEFVLVRRNWRTGWNNEEMWWKGNSRQSKTISFNGSDLQARVQCEMPRILVVQSYNNCTHQLISQAFESNFGDAPARLDPAVQCERGFLNPGPYCNARLKSSLTVSRDLRV